MINDLLLSDDSIEDVLVVTKALSTPTRYKILKLLASEERDISEIAERLELTEANISAQVKHLEKANLVSSRYEPGEHGVRKLCRTSVNSVTIKFSNNNRVEKVKIEN